MRAHDDRSATSRIDCAIVAITPDGKTAYVANIGDFGPGTVTPVATSTNTAGKPIKVGAGPTALVIAR